MISINVLFEMLTMTRDISLLIRHNDNQADQIIKSFNSARKIHFKRYQINDSAI